MIGIDELLGKSVIGSWGYYIGEVCNIEVETGTWKATYLHVKLSNKAAKEIGLRKPFKRTTVRIPTELVGTVGLIITLNQSLFGLKEVHDYDSTETVKRRKQKICN